MILIMKKTNVMMGVLILVLILAIVGINVAFGNRGDEVEAASPVGKVDAKGKIVVVDAGHGGEDPGAVSSYSGATEKDINLVIAMKTKELLEKEGYTVIMTRTEDVLVYEGEELSMTAKRRQDLLNRKKMMDESKADIVVSIHLNGFNDTKYSGAQVFYTKSSLSSKKLAICLQESLRETLDPKNEREALLKSDDIIITKNCKVTTVIVECGFLSNREEEAKLVDSDYQVKIAEAIKGGINKYFTVLQPASSASPLASPTSTPAS